MSINTYVINSVAKHATPSTAAPTPLPAFGSLMNWAGYAGWSVAPFEFAEDEFEFALVDENALVVKPPAREVKTAIIRNATGIQSITMTAYESGGKVFNWATNQSSVGGVYTFTKTHVRNALVIELGGIGIYYFPSVEIKVDPPRGGVWTLSRQIIRVDVFGTDAIPAGFQWIELQ